MRAVRFMFIASAIFIYLLLPSLSPGCGYSGDEITFTFDYQPEFPYPEFIGGKMGMIQPGLDRQNLFVAFRYLSNQSLNDGEKSALLEPPLTNQRSWWDEQSEANKVWKDARAAVVHDKTEIGIFRQYKQYDSFLNCPDDAFINAANTLKDRIGKFGAESEGMKAWVAAQDKVFSNCRDGEHIPDPAPDSLPALLRADRAYQIAAAHFYAQEFDDADTAFTAIAKDKSSPWHEIAPYLSARAVIRKATLVYSETPNAPRWDLASLQSAEQKLKNILADPAEKKWHADAERMMGYVAYRLHPNERLQQLENELGHPGNTDAYIQRLTDYIVSTRSDAESGNDMTDWIRLMRNMAGNMFETAAQNAKTAAAGHEEAVKFWDNLHSLPWMVATLYSSTRFEDLPSDLAAKASAVKPDSPVYLTVQYHMLRLRLGVTSEREKAIHDLDTLLEWPLDRLPLSSRNRLLALRLPVSRSYAEFVKYAPRNMVVDYGLDKEKATAAEIKTAEEKNFHFDPTGSDYLNHYFPLMMLEAMSTDEKLPAVLRSDLSIAVFTRAIWLNDEKIAMQSAKLLMETHPEGKELLQAYLDAKTSDEQHFAGIYALLNYPGLTPYAEFSPNYYRSDPDKIDSLSNNWWCYQKPSPDKAELPPFLKPDEIKISHDEERQLSKMPATSDWLTEESLKWAKAHPEDVRVPRALHRAVMATRYGCTDKETGLLSKAAFTLLHTRYPKSEWTKKTPYWFGGNSY